MSKGQCAVSDERDKSKIKMQKLKIRVNQRQSVSKATKSSDKLWDRRAIHRFASCGGNDYNAKDIDNASEGSGVVFFIRNYHQGAVL